MHHVGQQHACATKKRRNLRHTDPNQPKPTSGCPRPFLDAASGSSGSLVAIVLIWGDQQGCAVPKRSRYGRSVLKNAVNLNA